MYNVISSPGTDQLVYEASIALFVAPTRNSHLAIIVNASRESDMGAEWHLDFKLQYLLKASEVHSMQK